MTGSKRLDLSKKVDEADEWLIAARPNLAALGCRMDLAIPIPLLEQRRELSDGFPKARLRREGVELCTCSVWGSSLYSIRGCLEDCIIPTSSHNN